MRVANTRQIPLPKGVTSTLVAAISLVCTPVYGLSRRRSRVRVPSLPLSKCLWMLVIRRFSAIFGTSSPKRATVRGKRRARFRGGHGKPAHLGEANPSYSP